MSNGAKPAKPSIASNILIGFNQVTSHLEALSAISAQHLGVFTTAEKPTEQTKPCHIAAVFLLRPMDDLIYTHIPALCYTASLAHADLPPIRLIVLDLSVERRMVDALGCPRVSVIALLNGEEAIKVTEYVRKHVEVLEVPWLKQAAEARWLGTKVDVQ